MGGTATATGNNNRQKKYSFSLGSLFKPRRHRSRVDDSWAEEAGSGRTVWPSDEDKRYWVAEPGIDRKASAFIANFHATRVSEALNYQTVEKP